MKRRITSSLIAASMATFGLLPLASPANALSQGSYCFRYPGLGGAASNIKTLIQISTERDPASTAWHTVLEDTADIKGCGAFTLTGTYASDNHVRVIARNDVRGYGSTIRYSWLGVSPLYGFPGDGSSHLGDGIVYCFSVAASCNPSDEIPVPK